ncbi:MAG: YegS/Rv2252/BmrU family lipid kinase [Gammaproteobacteria bacterium]|jgi:diacylglycerol kinase (ATP)|nr:YegS/Rv2252/BmrU family lipid kinase [Gammaproteobacteria bacterium]
MAADTIHLFLNPTAGRGRAGRRQPRILELLEKSGVPIEYHASRSVGDLEAQVLRHVDAGVTRIVVAGGDGSVHEAVNGIMRSKNNAALGVIPTGTGNDFAKACDIPLNWEHATQLLGDRIDAEGAPRKIDVGRCNDRFYANGAGIGFDAKATRIAQSIRLPIGDLVYLLAIFRTMLGGIASPRLRITTGDYTWDGPLTLATISNGPWVGGMFHIAPMADNADNRMELLIAKPVTRRRILTLLPKLMNGEHMQEDEIIHQPVTSLSIKAEEPIPSHLDGEVQPLQTDFQVAVLPSALDLL